MRQLKAFPDHPEYAELIENKIVDFIRETIYLPLKRVLDEADIKTVKINGHYELHNVTSTLLSYILDGRIQYVDGRFTGRFSAATSRELFALGARYSRRFEAWTLEDAKLPMDVRQAIAQAAGKFEKLHSDLIGVIEGVNVDEAVENLNLSGDYKNVITGMDKDYREIAKAIGVTPEVTEHTITNLAIDYSNNMQLYIKDWAKEHILKLREDVYRNTFEGGRASNLVKKIMDDYGVGKAKAKFLARQENGLLVGKFTKSRYEDLGVRRWRWSAAMDNRTRDMHKQLHGQIFPINEPPIIDEKGNRGYPREAFGCRCRMVPLID